MSRRSIYNCANCQRVLQFRSNETHFISCACGKIWQLREDDELHPSEFPAPEKPVYSYLQPGSAGRFQEKRFEVIGLIRAWIRDGIIHYWTVIGEDGETGWLEESAGLYNLLQPARNQAEVKSITLTRSSTDSRYDLNPGEAYYQVLKYSWLHVEIAGEVWLPPVHRAVSVAVLSSEEGKTFQYFTFLESAAQAMASTGVDGEALHLQDLKAYPDPFEFVCQSCQTKIPLANPLEAITICCPKCHYVYFRQKNGDYARENKVEATDDSVLYAVGRIRGTEYQCIGVALKSEKDDPGAYWYEYTLFNSVTGYAWLTNWQNNWIFARQLKDEPLLLSNRYNNFEFDGKEFDKFSKYHAVVNAAAGAFPYHIREVPSYINYEFIAPPEGWFNEAHEQYGNHWSHGEHIDNDEVARFLGPSVAGRPLEMGMLTPGMNLSMPALLGITVFGLLFLVAVHLISTSGQNSREILPITMQLNPYSATSYVSKPFRLDHDWGNIGLHVYSPVSNSWAEAELKLTNLETGDEYSLNNEVEFYSGYEDGEKWTEGSDEGWTYLSHLPKGNYELEVYGSTGAPNSDLQLNVKYDMPMHKNLLICVLLALIWPVVSYFRVRQNITNRWYGNRFLPDRYDFARPKPELED